MTAADTRRGTGIGIHAVYPDLSYDIDLMRDYFATFAAVWRSCFGLAHYRYTGETLEPDEFPQASVWPSPRTGDEPIRRLRPPRLRVHRLSIHSPMEITFAVEGGAAVIAAYTAYLFARVLRSPENLGAWVPRLVAGWHQGWREAETQKSARGLGRKRDGGDRLPIPEQARPVQELVKTGDDLFKLNMQADEVTTIGLDDVPDDLADLDTP